MQKLLGKMKNTHILIHFLLAFIFLAVAAASHSHFSNSDMVQAVESAEFRLEPPQPGSPSSSGSTVATLESIRKTIEGRKTRKVPSGPSPIGNRHPQTKP